MDTVVLDIPGLDDSGVEAYFGIIAARARCEDVSGRLERNVVTSGDVADGAGVDGGVCRRTQVDTNRVIQIIHTPSSHHKRN